MAGLSHMESFMMPAREFFRFCGAFQRVVPANAGTHTARTLNSALEQRPFFTFEARGDGSLRSQGRPAQKLVRGHDRINARLNSAICDSPRPLRGRAGEGGS